MSTTSNVPIDSKSAKKRKVKTETSPSAPTAGRDSPALESGMNGLSVHDSTNGAHDSHYMREISKSIRNLSKKLHASSKADQIVEQNPGISLDELLAQKKLNADQKAQLLKKPQLQAQLVQLEEQQKSYLALATEFEAKYAAERAELVESHQKALAQASSDAAQTSSAQQLTRLEQGLKVITGFLHAAAAKRQTDDQDSEEAKAFEGALLLVYQGNSSSLNTLRQLVNGSDEKVPDTESNPLDYTFAQIREAALKNVGNLSDDGELVAETGAGDTAPAVATEPASDPTIVNAGLTELEDTNAMPVDTKEVTDEQLMIPEQASIGADAANAVAEANWDPQSSVISSQTPTGDDWVQVPRDPAETENGSVQPAISQSTANWADEAGDAAAEQKAAAAENDGFEQVRRDRGGRGRGGPRGRGFDGRGRGRGRGDGHRGRGGPGRGRGGPRGDRGGATPAPKAS